MTSARSNMTRKTPISRSYRTHTHRHQPVSSGVYVTLASVTAVVSLTLRTLYLAEANSVIPPLLGG